MKLQLDENLPKRLKLDFEGHETYTVRDKGWNGKTNGELLSLMIHDGFEVLLTFDKNLQYQQNFKKYSIPVLVINSKDNTYIHIKNLVPKILRLLTTPLKNGPHIIS